MLRTLVTVGLIAPISTWNFCAGHHGAIDGEGQVLDGALTAQFLSVGTGGVGSNLPAGPWAVDVREWGQDDWTRVHSFAQVTSVSIPPVGTTQIGTQLLGSLEMRLTTQDGRSCVTELNGEGWAGVPPVTTGPWTRTWVDGQYTTGGPHYRCTLSETSSTSNGGDTWTQCRTQARQGTNLRVRLSCQRLVTP